jgi:protein-L-isoaspartate(D-aspartate) O-methyltransferase
MMWRGAAVLLTALQIPGPATPSVAAPDDRAPERARMVDAIVRMVTATRRQTGVDALSPRVEAAMRTVPRHHFVDEDEAGHAYADHPLPIGEGQTISQPYMVALMTELAAPQAGDRILEIGTGSGYQAAVLGTLAGQVETIEIIDALARGAAARLEALGHHNVRVHIGDGWHGVPEHGPYDAIVVTAVAPSLPPPLLAQLRPGGRVVIPIGPEHGAHDLMVYTLGAAGDVSERWVLPVRFVPLTRAED